MWKYLFKQCCLFCLFKQKNCTESVQFFVLKTDTLSAFLFSKIMQINILQLRHVRWGIAEGIKFKIRNNK
ncbi:hypothetical protein A8C56_11150 [Niabella ginsenosidivorans]|uniref:Uncharacterized protein n=1 Tax=Niabella ginsenosidivorans TaxID=1176587 RepID=A0A1A9I1R1_9BACT|nr:hypothetical protein A8C56_11150 [Niabella ginsenosidivorans]